MVPPLETEAPITVQSSSTLPIMTKDGFSGNVYIHDRARVLALLANGYVDALLFSKNLQNFK